MRQSKYYDFLKDRIPREIGENEVRHSAVVIPLIDTPGGIELLFEVRSVKLHHQPGDICFPGGGVEPGETPEAAAMRELQEELLVSPSQVEWIGPTDYFGGGNRRIDIYVCRLKDYAGTFSSDEVDEVFRVPLAFFQETAPEVHEVKWKPEFPSDFPFDKIYGGRDYPWRTSKDRILFYEYEDHVIWGMTARIVENFSQL